MLVHICMPSFSLWHLTYITLYLFGSLIAFFLQLDVISGRRGLKSWTSLVVQWIGIRLPMQGCGFNRWSGKIPRAVRQLKPVRHNDLASVPQLPKPT